MTILMRLNIAFLTIYAGTMLWLNHGHSDIQVMVANTICAIMISIITTKMVWTVREHFEKMLFKSPWLSGFIGASSLWIIFISFNPLRYTTLISYTTTIMAVPVFALLSIISVHTRVIHLEKLQKRRKATTDKKTPIITPS